MDLVRLVLTARKSETESCEKPIGKATGCHGIYLQSWGTLGPTATFICRAGSKERRASENRNAGSGQVQRFVRPAHFR